MNPWVGPLPAYFLSLMTGLALATFVVRREALRHGLDPRLVLDCAFFILPAALIGARLAHVVFETPAFYVQNPWLMFSPDGGLVFYGGLAGALLAGWSYSRHRQVSLLALADCYAPATAFGLVFGRLGCLGGGCCFGRPADWPFGVVVPWAVTYHHRGQLPLNLQSVPLHPAPLYEALLCIALFAALSGLAARRRFVGEVLLGLFVGYGVLRSAVEAFRADDIRGLWLGGWLSTSQIIGLTSAAVALTVWRSVASHSVLDR